MWTERQTNKHGKANRHIFITFGTEINEDIELVILVWKYNSTGVTPMQVE
jgi:hypothetical protein